MSLLENYIVPISAYTDDYIRDIIECATESPTVAVFWDFQRKDERSSCSINQTNSSYFNNDRHLIVQVQYAIPTWEIEKNETIADAVDGFKRDVTNFEVARQEKRVSRARAKLEEVQRELESEELSLQELRTSK